MSKLLYKKIFFLPLLLSITGCAGFFPDPYDISGQQKPYTVRGVKYYPLATADGFEEIGIASWYGPDFHGKRTANGEIYNQHLYTAAHKTLPLNTYVYVENLENGETIRVKINDRGPFAEGRIIDLSRKGALELGMLEKGTARVRVYESKNVFAQFLESFNDNNEVSQPNVNKPLESTSIQDTVATPPALSEKLTSSAQSYESDQTYVAPSSSGGSTYITLGSFSTRAEANKAVETLANLGLAARVIPSRSGYLVDSGPYASKKDAQNKIAVLKSRFPKVKLK